MALKTLENVKKVGEFNLVVMDKLREEHPEKFNSSGAMNWEWFESEVRPNNFVYLRLDKNSLSFTVQNGPRPRGQLVALDVLWLLKSGRVLHLLPERMVCVLPVFCERFRVGCGKLCDGVEKRDIIDAQRALYVSDHIMLAHSFLIQPHAASVVLCRDFIRRVGHAGPLGSS